VEKIRHTILIVYKLKRSYICNRRNISKVIAIVNRRRTDNTKSRRRTVKGERDKQRSSRIYEDKFSTSPLKLVVTVLK
jgi:hypothetical protein